MAAATPNLQEIRLPESGTCIAQGKKLTHDESLEIEVQVTFKLHLLPRPRCDRNFSETPIAIKPCALKL